MIIQVKYIDIHSHKKQDTDAIRIVDLSEELDANLRIKHYYSLGIHPWYIKESMLDEQLMKIEVHMNANSFLTIGECGLDKVCATGIELQLLAFKKQIALSEKYQKPLVLHVVKAYNDVMQLRLATGAKQTWIVHGFNGSPQLAKQLTDLGLYISFGSQLGKYGSKVCKSIASVPLNRLFLETDNSDYTIEDIYTLAAACLNMDKVQLRQHLRRNFQEVFRQDF